MKEKQRFWVMAVLSAAFLAACATQPAVKAPSFDAQPIQGQWIPKADNLYFILDASSSMDEFYADCSKFETARAIVARFNQTMPDLDVQTTLRGFGFHAAVSDENTSLFYGPGDYKRSGLADGLGAVTRPGGASPIASALRAAASDLKGKEGPVALVIVSDGKDMDQESLAATHGLTAQLKDRLCLYTVLVGNDPAGKALLEKIAASSACGKASTADGLASGASMAAFVQEVILGKKADADGDGVSNQEDKCPGTPRGVQVDASGCPLDGDGDGVADYLDKCPGTPRGVQVDASGCPIPMATKSAEVTEAGTWIYRSIQFETDRAELKPGSYPALHEIAAGLQAQPSMRLEVQGHTDNRGNAGYNRKLSEKRAQAVVSYLIGKGIDAERLIPRGYGDTRPIASNETSEGRATNRRVELKPIP
ncbi:MAG TPA: OmpA family protein [Syntrophales bacterium]|nr:OmpA family protein [Syntrophales bacterium]HQQ26036.1 OmpA family protein [Syntrophales bacterium]